MHLLPVAPTSSASSPLPGERVRRRAPAEVSEAHRLGDARRLGGGRPHLLGAPAAAGAPGGKRKSQSVGRLIVQARVVT